MFEWKGNLFDTLDDRSLTLEQEVNTREELIASEAQSMMCELHEELGLLSFEMTYHATQGIGVTLIQILHIDGSLITHRVVSI